MYGREVTYKHEVWAHAQVAPHTLMQRAGLAVANLAMAIAPHARTIWVACGPGNNGGDGYEAARHLKNRGKLLVVTSANPTGNLPPDATTSRQAALLAGLDISESAPPQFDLCIDALFGIGQLRAFGGPFDQWIDHMNVGVAPVLAVDTPSGLDADSGMAGKHCVQADFTLSLLTLKPGLFTGDGRAASGEIWFNSLDIDEASTACAQLNEPPSPHSRSHNTHKGSFGDVCVVGGAQGMTGAAVLAAQAALGGGAGRVYLVVLDKAIQQLNSGVPEVMFRTLADIAYESAVMVVGCGGGEAIATHLADIIYRSARLVLDADALNAIAADTSLQQLLAARDPNTTVLTPHPLEAARLMNMQCQAVQANRIEVAQSLANRFGCTVALKGSGTIIAAPGLLPRINTTGCARLATAGTGDVLAGLIGARFATAVSAFQATCDSVFHHGEIASTWAEARSLTAQRLAMAVSMNQY